MAVVGKELGVGFKPFAQWFELLEGTVQDEALLNATPSLLPAVRLIDFFRYARDHAARKLDSTMNRDAYDGFLLPRFDMTKMLAASPSLADLPPLGIHDVQKWLTFSAVIAAKA